MSAFIIGLLIALSGVTTASQVCLGKCPIQISPNSSIIFLPNVNCSRYCVCDHGRPIEMLCPANLHFSIEYNTCADPEQANCTDLTSTIEVISEEAPNSNNYSEKSISEFYSNPGIRLNTYCANLLADCRDKPLECIGECPSDYGYQIHLLAHEDCTLYCRCNNTLAVTKKCSDGLHFSFEEGLCLPPQEAKCDRVNGIISTTESSDQSYSCASECPHYNNPDLVVLVAHELCGKYCHCKNEIAEPKDCPLHLHFSLPHGTCVDPDIAQCYNPDTVTTKPITSKPITSTPELITSTPELITSTPELITSTPELITSTPELITITPEPITSTPLPSKPPGDADKLGCVGICPANNDPFHTSQLPHIDCNKFCKCDWGKPSVMYCPPSLFYNPNNEVCDYPYAAGCTGNKPKSSRFSKSYRKKISTIAKSILSKLELDSSGCIGTCPLDVNLNETFNLPHEYCNKYCKCESKKVSVYECPYPLFYNPIEEVCDHPYLAGCTGKIPGFGSEYKNRKQNASLTADCVEPCPFTNLPNQTVHVAHKNCSKFCKCAFGIAWVMDCPENLYFNPKEQVCDFKFNVYCDENGPWVDQNIINEKNIDQSQTNNVLENDSIWDKLKHLFNHQ